MDRFTMDGNCKIGGQNVYQASLSIWQAALPSSAGSICTGASGLGPGLGLEVPLGGSLALGLGLALAVAGLVLAFMVLGLVFAAPALRLVVRGLTALGLEGEVTVLTPVATDLDSMLGGHNCSSRFIK